jgi:hypothetical protein
MFFHSVCALEAQPLQTDLEALRSEQDIIDNWGKPDETELMFGYPLSDAPGQVSFIFSPGEKEPGYSLEQVFYGGTRLWLKGSDINDNEKSFEAGVKLMEQHSMEKPDASGVTVKSIGGLLSGQVELGVTTVISQLGIKFIIPPQHFLVYKLKKEPAKLRIGIVGDGGQIKDWNPQREGVISFISRESADGSTHIIKR